MSNKSKRHLIQLSISCQLLNSPVSTDLCTILKMKCLYNVYKCVSDTVCLFAMWVNMIHPEP